MRDYCKPEDAEELDRYFTGDLRPEAGSRAAFCSALWRDDGEKFSRNDDGTYSMDSSKMANPYRYTFGRLMDTGAFSVYPPNNKD